MRLKASCGDVVVDLPAEVKLVVVAMLPREIPCDVTVDVICVMARAAVKGLTRFTVTSLMLFATPVVGSTDSKLENTTSERSETHR